jgi:hypothetical protein
MVWNVMRDGTAKTVRTREDILTIEKMTGYKRHYIVAASMIDVKKAIVASQGKSTPEEVLEAVRPLLFGALAHAKR